MDGAIRSGGVAPACRADGAAPPRLGIAPDAISSGILGSANKGYSDEVLATVLLIS